MKRLIKFRKTVNTLIHSVWYCHLAHNMLRHYPLFFFQISIYDWRVSVVLLILIAVPIAMTIQFLYKTSLLIRACWIRLPVLYLILSQTLSKRWKRVFNDTTIERKASNQFWYVQRLTAANVNNAMLVPNSLKSENENGKNTNPVNCFTIVL